MASLHSATTNPGSYIELMTYYTARSAVDFCTASDKASLPFIKRDNSILITLANDPLLYVSFIDLVHATKDASKLPTLNTLKKIWIKEPKIHHPHKYFIEYLIGLTLNQFQYFPSTLGLLASHPDRVALDLDCLTDPVTSFNIIQAKTQGKSLLSYLKNPSFTENDFYIILIHICLMLEHTQTTVGFMHNALYPENILITEIDDEIEFRINIQNETFTIKTKYIPSIVDLSSARVCRDDGFGLCYQKNPNLFNTGEDLYKLISSCLAHLADNITLAGGGASKPSDADTDTLFGKVKWINNYFDNFFDIKDGVSYGTNARKYKNFTLPEGHYLLNRIPLEFIQWYASESDVSHASLGISVDKLVLTGTRARLPDSFDVETNIEVIHSGIIKKYIDDDYSPTATEILKDTAYDANIEQNFKDWLSKTDGTHKLTVNYNFPIGMQYDGIDFVGLFPYILNSFNYRTYLSLFALLRQAISANKQLSFSENTIADIFERKNISKKNKDRIEHLFLYRLYACLSILDRVSDNNGTTVTIREEFDTVIKSIKLAFPILIDFMDKNVNEYKAGLVKMSRNLKDPVYYPTYSLIQIKQLAKDSKLKDRLVSLVNKTLFGNDEKHKKTISDEITDLVSQNKNDVDIYLYLKKYQVDTEQKDEFRVKAKVKQIKMIIETAGQFPQIVDLVKKSQAVYLDYGGNNGMVSSALAKELNVSKENAYSADVKYWNETQQEHVGENITYVTIKEDQPLPFEDRSFDIITCLQVLHHIKNKEFVISELSRICRGILILREHDCEDNNDRMLIDVEHSIVEITTKNISNLKYLNGYEAYYERKQYWSTAFTDNGLKEMKSIPSKPTPTKYYYSVFIKPPSQAKKQIATITTTLSKPSAKTILASEAVGSNTSSKKVSPGGKVLRKIKGYRWDKILESYKSLEQPVAVLSDFDDTLFSSLTMTKLRKNPSGEIDKNDEGVFVPTDKNLIEYLNHIDNLYIVTNRSQDGIKEAKTVLKNLGYKKEENVFSSKKGNISISKNEIIKNILNRLEHAETPIKFKSIMFIDDEERNIDAVAEDEYLKSKYNIILYIYNVGKLWESTDYKIMKPVSNA